jgi:hypothetical protein
MKAPHPLVKLMPNPPFTTQFVEGILPISEPLYNRCVKLGKIADMNE